MPNKIIKLVRLANGNNLRTAAGAETSVALTAEDASQAKYLACMISCVNTPAGGTTCDVQLEATTDQFAVDASAKWFVLPLRLDGKQTNTNPSVTADINRVRFVTTAKDYEFWKIDLPANITKIRANIASVTGTYTTGVGLQIVGAIYSATV